MSIYAPAGNVPRGSGLLGSYGTGDAAALPASRSGRLKFSHRQKVVPTQYARVRSHDWPVCPNGDFHCRLSS